jgi:hypothetical protein
MIFRPLENPTGPEIAGHQLTIGRECRLLRLDHSDGGRNLGYP